MTGQHDLFGLLKEQKVLASGIREVFTPHAPIASKELFYGRQDQVEGIVKALMTPGQHVVLYGERGVGKSSLANVATTTLLGILTRGKCYPYRCDSTSGFQRVFHALLSQMGYALPPSESVVSRTEGGQAGFKIPVASAGVKTEGTRSTKTVLPSFDLSPAQIAAFLADKEGLFVIDEIDAMPGDEQRGLAAEVMKQLSDARSRFKILAVGIARSCDDLLKGHPSVQRCIREVRLDRMLDDEIRLIVKGGATKVNLAFEDAVVARIVELSSGYPYFTHLLCLNCAENAIGADRRLIELQDLHAAVKASVKDAEGTLQRQYSEAVRSHSTGMYRSIIQAASQLDAVEFSASALRRTVSQLVGRNVTQNELNNHFQRLVSNDGSSILTREAKGVYRFSDPRMRSFVRLAVAADGAN